MRETTASGLRRRLPRSVSIPRTLGGRRCSHPMALSSKGGEFWRRLRRAETHRLPFSLFIKNRAMQSTSSGAVPVLPARMART